DSVFRPLWIGWHGIGGVSRLHCQHVVLGDVSQATFLPGEGAIVSFAIHDQSIRWGWVEICSLMSVVHIVFRHGNSQVYGYATGVWELSCQSRVPTSVGRDEQCLNFSSKYTGDLRVLIQHRR